MRVTKTVVALAALLGVALPALAQEPPGAPPVMRITVEDIKPGSMAQHEKQVASYLSLFSRAQASTPRIGMVPVAGDQNQVVYLEAFPSFAALEEADNKLEAALSSSPSLQSEFEALERSAGPLHASQRAMIAVLRTDLSYRPKPASVVGRSRFFGVTTTRVKLGHTPDFEAYVKQTNRAREKANVDESTAVYQVTTGAQAGTFMTFTANRSLAEIDAARGGMAARNKAVDEALGGEEVVRQRRSVVADIVVDSRSALYALNPKLSNPPAQLAAADPDFWAPKVPGKALAVKKDEKK